LLWNVLIGVGLIAGGAILGWPVINLLPLMAIGWLTANLYSALRADHDLNRLQITKFHCNSPQAGNNVFEVDKSATECVDPRDSITPILREKIYN
jgi:hypothetical protein